MSAMTLDMPKAALIRQDSGRLRRVPPHPSKVGRTYIMTQPDIEFTAEECAEVATLTDTLYRKALRLIEEANQFRAMASLPPVDATGLYAYLVPRQAVSQ